MIAQLILLLRLALLLAFQAVPASAPKDDLARELEPPVARGGGLTLGASELDPILVGRYAMTAEGREALDHLLTTRVVLWVLLGITQWFPLWELWLVHYVHQIGNK